MRSKSTKNIRLEEAIGRFLDRLEATNRTENTIIFSGCVLRQMADALSSRGNLDPWVHLVTDDQMDAYCFGRNGLAKRISAQGFNRYRSVLRGFWEYASRMEWIDENPMARVESLRAGRSRRRLLLNASELLGLLDYCETPVERIGCAIGMNTGLRSADIAGLTVGDASLASGEIQTQIRKTRDFDVKVMPVELHRELTRWLETYERLAGRPVQPHWALVPSGFRRPLWVADRPGELIPDVNRPHTRPSRLVQRPLERMGYAAKQEGFHTLRRSSARALFEALRDDGESRDHALMIVQAYLNHKNVAMTQHYIGLESERAIRDTILKDRPFLSALAVKEQNRLGKAPEVATLEGRRAANG